MENELVMPFVLCESRGGPFEDKAFTAGWWLGALDYRLSEDKDSGRTPGTHYGETVMLPQVDLIAMRWGFNVTFTPLAEPQEWWGRYDYSANWERP